MWWAPGRGTSSIIRTPDCFSSAIRSSMSVDGEGDVMESLAALLQERRDRAGGSVGSSNSSRTSPMRKNPTRTFWSGTVLDALEHRPEGAFIERPLGVDGADGDADVVDGFDGGHGSLLLVQTR